MCVLPDDKPTGMEICNSVSFLTFIVLINIIVRYKLCIWLAFLIFPLHILKIYFMIANIYIYYIYIYIYIYIVNFKWFMAMHWGFIMRYTSLLTYLINYLFTPWCRVLLEKLTGLQLVKFPAFHGTRRFITALTSVRHLSLSWASPIQSNPYTHIPPPGDPSQYYPPIYA